MTRTVEKAVFGLLVVLLLSMGTVFVSATIVGKNVSNSNSSLDASNIGYDTSIEVSEIVDFENEDDVPLTSLATITEEEAIMTAQNWTQGIVVDTELEYEDAIVMYSIEMEKNGSIFDVKVDAKTGVVLNVEYDEDNLQELDDEDTTLEKNVDVENDGIDYQFDDDEDDEEE